MSVLSEDALCVDLPHVVNGQRSGRDHATRLVKVWPPGLWAEDHVVDLNKPKVTNNVFQPVVWIPTWIRFGAHTCFVVKVCNVEFVVCAVAIQLTEAPRRCIGHASTNFAFPLKVFAV